MSRLLALFGNVGKLSSHSVLCNGTGKSGFFIANNNCSGAENYWLSRFLANNARVSVLRSCRVHRNNYGGVSSNALSYCAFVAWRSLSRACVYNGRSLARISKIAGAFSLALTRSNLVAPGIVAFIISEFARSQCAQAESFLSGEKLSTQARDGHAYLTAFAMTIFDGVILLFRAVYLMILFLPCITMAPFADSLGPEFRKMWLRVVHLTLAKAGPAFIKWGQWAATRPDLFPQDVCVELAELHSKAPAHSFAITRTTIERAFGRKLSDIFSRFEEEPLASESVAQVHRASLKCRYPGQEMKPIEVAVKVRHPGVGEAIRRDFLLINFASKIAKPGQNTSNETVARTENRMD